MFNHLETFLLSFAFLDQVQNVETEVATKKVTVTTTLSQEEIVEKLKKAGRTAKAI